MSYEITALIAAVVMVALLVARKVEFKSKWLSLFSNKNKEKDSISVEDITKKSKIEIDEPRENLNVSVKKVKESVVNIKRK
jgi:CO dehydrogenase/acetyl-CoA synthase alpha subunit